MKVIVTQNGARRRYLIPQILSDCGMLKCLYTDSQSGSLLGQFAKFLSRLGISNARLKRLTRREHKLPREQVRANDWLQLRLAWQAITKASPYKTSETITQGSSQAYIRWGCEGADWLYAMFIETFDFTRYAKEHGVKVIADIYENPYIYKDLANEIDSLPELSCLGLGNRKEQYMGMHRRRMKYVDNLLATADQYLIPSVYVRDALRDNSPAFSEGKVNIVPYPTSIPSSKYDNSPVKGRVIWVGNDAVRKGLVYLLRAAKIIKERYPFTEFRIIGPVQQAVVDSPDFSIFKFLGYLNKTQLQEEFRKADMYVFPTLAEGLAGSLLEAASFGVPVITTHASGYESDFPGLFIRERSVDDIVDSVALLLEDRQRRDIISHEIFAYSQERDSENFKNKLIEILTTK